MRQLIFLFLILTSLNAFAQKEYTSSVPKAITYYETALKFYNNRDNDRAIDAVENSIKGDKNFIEAHMLKANILTDMKLYERAILAYKDAIAINENFFPNNYYSLGKVEYTIGSYSDAKIHFEKFITYPKVKGSLLWKAKQYIEWSDFSIQALNNPVPFDPKNLGDSINTSNGEYLPSITADGKTLLFTRRIMFAQNEKFSGQEDIYMSHLINGKWNKAEPVSELNTAGNEGASTLSSDGQYLFFTSCNDQVNVEGARKTLGSCDIFLSKKIGNKFTLPRNLDGPINTNQKETMPSFSSDGRTLYFVRRIPTPDGQAQYDIMVSHISDNFGWSEPVSVSDLINTKDDELSVFIHPDDQTLYFCSNGHPGLGGFDIFMSRKDSLGNWQQPVNLGYPINTNHDEESILVCPDGKTAYFDSDRDGGYGNEDLYQFSLYDKVQPKPITYMKGKVFDIESKRVLAATFELIDLATGKTVVSSTSNIGNGEFIVALPTGKSYALNVSKDGYLFYSENFQLENVKSAKDPVLKDVPMKPIKAGQSIVLKNIFYDTDKFDLKDASRIELGKLVYFLNRNPKVRFEISGHTDNVGTKPYNQTLSEKRAKSVYDFLLGKGIAASRMSSIGYGDSKPVAENTTDSGRAQNRRTEFMVVSVE